MPTATKPPIRISPSIMCMDLMSIGEGIRAMDPYVDEFHADVIDWHYCRNMCLAPCFVEGMARLTERPIEVHLYVEGIDDELVDLCVRSGARIVTMPADGIGRNVFRFRRKLEEAGVGFGVFLNPSTPLAAIGEYADMIDRLLVLTVDPGFAGQPIVPVAVRKVSEAVRLRKEGGLSFDIEVDGCCNKDTYAMLAEAGADTFVVGGGLFSKGPDLAEACRELHEDIAQALG